ncbi:hypothetical protein GCM10010512_17870 [Streptomyces thermoviolaceus subsp. thermoviolaceus]|nr:hypothetical protein GCM10010499_20460 [Streptomyces thermoviolaceus subsp. apingens]GHA86775.1 hypothetical protein GCM10010512_17870 [Streptomyces thermoviolaceus subsp. thermoviolaceus]
MVSSVGWGTPSVPVRAKNTSSRSGVHGQFAGLDTGCVEAVEEQAQGALAAVAGDLQGEGRVVALWRVQGGRGVLVGHGVGEAEADVASGDQPGRARRWSG